MSGLLFSWNPTINPATPWAAGAFRFSAEELPDGCVRLTSANDFWARDRVCVGDWFVIAHEPRDLSNCLMVECRDVSLVDYRILNGIGMGLVRRGRRVECARAVWIEGRIGAAAGIASAAERG